MHVEQTYNADRREQAADSRGLPSSYTRALKALEGACAHCTQRAVVANGSGVGLCAAHRNQRAEGIALRERLRREIDIERALHG